MISKIPLEERGKNTRSSIRKDRGKIFTNKYFAYIQNSIKRNLGIILIINISSDTIDPRSLYIIHTLYSIKESNT